MTFSLLDSPFAVLGISAGASVRAIHDRAREIGSPQAQSAAAALINPRRRLQIELEFLPGATPEVASAVLRCVGQGDLPVLAELSATAQANVLAHIAGVGKASVSQLRDLAEIQDRISEERLLGLVAADRVTAGMPAPIGDQLTQCLESLKEVHAAALVAGARSQGAEAGASVLASLIDSAKSGQPRRMLLLRAAVAGWGRETAAQVARLEEESAQAEKSLSAAAAPGPASRLADRIRSWAKLTEPQRAIDAAASLRHEDTFRLARRWHGLACDLVNESGAAGEALAILCALEDAFGGLADIGARIRDDRKAVEPLGAAARERDAPSIKTLEAAIAEAGFAHRALRRSLNGSIPPPVGGPPVVGRLVVAFAAATNAACSEHPWHLMRAFALALHNDQHLTAPALSLTLMMLQAARAPRCAGKVSAELLHQLQTDARILRNEHLTQALTAAIKSGRLGKALALLDRLISCAGDAAQRRELSTARKNLVRRLWARRAKSGLGLAVAALVLWGIANATRAPPQSAAAPGAAPTAQLAAPTPPPPAVPPAPPVPATVVPTQPSVGETTLSQAELLWCLEEQELLDAARARLTELRGRSPAPEFNAAVDQFNSQLTAYRSACYKKEYFDSDKSAIQAELAASVAALRLRGEALVMDAIDSAAAGERGNATVPATATPDATAASSAPAAGGDLGDPHLALRVQQELAAKGFDPGPEDGVFGPMSRAALEAFKRSRGISPADDSLNQQTIRALAN